MENFCYKEEYFMGSDIDDNILQTMGHTSSLPNLFFQTPSHSWSKTLTLHNTTHQALPPTHCLQG